MVELDGRRVVSSTHAADQALRRVSLLRGADRVAASYWIEQTAARALRDGRRASNCPRWCVRTMDDGRTHRGKLRRAGVVRYLWNEAESAAFVAAHVRDVHRERGRVWVVVTVLTPDS